MVFSTTTRRLDELAAACFYLLLQFAQPSPPQWTQTFFVTTTLTCSYLGCFTQTGRLTWRYTV